MCGAGYNAVKGPGFLGTSGRDQSKNAQGEIADPNYGKDGSYSLKNGREYFDATDEEKLRLTKQKILDHPANAHLKPDPEKAALAPPTLSEDLMVKARKRAFLKLSTGQSRKESFSSGPAGDLATQTQQRGLGGY